MADESRVQGRGRGAPFMVLMTAAIGKIDLFHWDLDSALAEERCKMSPGNALEILPFTRKLPGKLANPLRGMRGESMPAILFLLMDAPAFLKAILEKDIGSIAPPMDWREAGVGAGMRSMSRNPLDRAVMGRVR